MVSVDFLGITPSRVLSPPPEAPLAPRYHLVCLGTLEPCPCKFRAGEDVPLLIFLWLSLNSPQTEAGGQLTTSQPGAADSSGPKLPPQWGPELRTALAPTGCHPVLGLGLGGGQRGGSQEETERMLRGVSPVDKGLGWSGRALRRGQPLKPKHQDRARLTKSSYRPRDRQLGAAEGLEQEEHGAGGHGASPSFLSASASHLYMR